MPLSSLLFSSSLAALAKHVNDRTEGTGTFPLQALCTVDLVCSVADGLCQANCSCYVHGHGTANHEDAYMQAIGEWLATTKLTLDQVKALEDAQKVSEDLLALVQRTFVPVVDQVDDEPINESDSEDEWFGNPYAEYN